MSDQSTARVFDALGDPVRRQILQVLSGGAQPVGRIAERLPVGRPAVSRHLRVLGAADLVVHRSVGTRNLYALAPGGLEVARRWLTRTWDGVLAAYAAEVTRLDREGDSDG